MDQKGAKRKANTPPDLSDRNPPNPADSSADEFVSNMEQVFADDKKREEEAGPSAPQEQRKFWIPPAIFYSHTVFWMKNDGTSQKVGVTIHRGYETQLSFVVSDHKKAVVRCIRVDDADFEFDLDDKIVLLRKKDAPMPEDLAYRAAEPSVADPQVPDNFQEPIRLHFPDNTSITNLCMTILLRSSTHEHFLLRSGGRRDVEGEELVRNEPEILICEGHEVSYVRSKYTCNGHSTVGPEVSNRRKVLDQEKLDSDPMYKWFGGHQKGACFAIKVGNAAYKIEIAKLKMAESSSEGTPPSDEGISLASGRGRPDEHGDEQLVRRNFDDPPGLEDDAEYRTDEEVVSTYPDPAAASAPAILSPTPAPRTIRTHPPLPPSSPTSEDIRDVLHRIVGIELDRIEMRLNAKFEQLQINITNRLDHHTELLEKLVSSSVQKSSD